MAVNSVCRPACLRLIRVKSRNIWSHRAEKRCMCLWKSPRTKSLQWWIIEDGAGDLRRLGGTGTSLARSLNAWWNYSVLFCSIRELHWSPSLTCTAVLGYRLFPRLHQILHLQSYFLFWSSIPHQMMVHWESHSAWKTKICLFLPERIHCAWLWLALLFSTQQLNSFVGFLKKKKRDKALKATRSSVKASRPHYSPRD